MIEPTRHPSLQTGLEQAFDTELVASIVHSHSKALARHGDLARWREAQTKLPAVQTGWQFRDRRLIAGNTAADLQELTETLRTFIPWRKGPLELGGVGIDTEWRSDWKWARIAPHVDLTDQRVLDVGCGNGYFGWAMLAAGAQQVIGCDPTQLFVIQHEVISHFAGEANHQILALRLEDLPPELNEFDTVFSMGVIYHRRDHLAHLTDLAARLRPGGQLVLETLIIDGKTETLLAPEDRYANMRNVHALPTVALLQRWLQQAGYTDIDCVDITPTTTQEQRTTEWMPFHSLPEALNPTDPTRTREDHPSPLRAVVLARKK